MEIAKERLLAYHNFIQLNLKVINMKRLKLTISLLVLALGGCVFGYPKVEFSSSGDALVLKGVIDGSTLDNLQAALRANSGINRLVLQHIPGSADDENSLTALADYVRASGLTTVVPADGAVASGGTDLILMGKTRRIEPGACIGVHTWAAGGLFGEETGIDLPKSHPTHQMYLNFYDKMGIPEDFYWFTLKAAGPDDIYWMTEDEINKYGLSTFTVRGSPKESRQQREDRCYARIDAE